MPTSRVRVSLAFARLTDGNLSKFAGGVIDGLTEQSVIVPDLPVDVATLTVLKGTFDNARAATVDAGESATAAKNIAREALIDGLREDGLYAEIVAKNDLSVLLSLGYKATSTNRAPAPLQQVEVLQVTNPESGALKVRPKPQPNVRSYEGRIKAAGSEYGPSISFAGARKILFDGLIAGLKYTLQLRAIGGSTGKSDWSDPVEKMAM